MSALLEGRGPEPQSKMSEAKLVVQLLDHLLSWVHELTFAMQKQMTWMEKYQDAL